MRDPLLKDAPLGKQSSYSLNYDPSLLFTIPRQNKREDIQVKDPLPFDGIDIWNAYELSWLNEKGKPQIALAEIFVPCRSPRIFESKSFKLYLNSFNQSAFSSAEKVKKIIEGDLTKAAGANVEVNLFLPNQFNQIKIGEFDGISIDDIDLEISSYNLSPQFLTVGEKIVEETLCSNLLKSNCLGTGQPDWASLSIHYVGPQINRENLLRYIISFRNHNEFGEHCVERIFMDLLKRCNPQRLSVYGRYTRRGGIDLNPHRTNFPKGSFAANIRNFRQ